MDAEWISSFIKRHHLVCDCCIYEDTSCTFALEECSVRSSQPSNTSYTMVSSCKNNELLTWTSHGVINEFYFHLLFGYSLLSFFTCSKESIEVTLYTHKKFGYYTHFYLHAALNFFPFLFSVAWCHINLYTCFFGDLFPVKIMKGSNRCQGEISSDIKRLICWAKIIHGVLWQSGWLSSVCWDSVIQTKTLM